MFLDKEYLTVTEASMLATVTERTIYRWISHGILKTLETPTGRPRIKRIDVISCPMLRKVMAERGEDVPEMDDEPVEMPRKRAGGPKKTDIT